MITFSATLACQYDTLFSPFPAAQFSRGLDWLAESGFDAAELCINDYEELDVKSLRHALRRRGLGCTTIATGQARKRDGLTLLSADKTVVRRTQTRLFEHIDAAAELSSHVTVGSLRVTALPLDTAQYMNELAVALHPCVEYARRNGVVLILEALNRYEVSQLHSAQEMMDYMAFSDAPENVGVLWDMFHASIEDPDFTQAIATLGARLRHVHLADSNRGFPGYGHMPVEEIVAALRQAEYQGAVSLECLCRPSVQTVIDEAERLLAKLRQR